MKRVQVSLENIHEFFAERMRRIFGERGFSKGFTDPLVRWAATVNFARIIQRVMNREIYGRGAPVSPYLHVIAEYKPLSGYYLKVFLVITDKGRVFRIQVARFRVTKWTGVFGGGDAERIRRFAEGIVKRTREGLRILTDTLASVNIYLG